jgi:hypothetical protein
VVLDYFKNILQLLVKVNIPFITKTLTTPKPIPCQNSKPYYQKAPMKKINHYYLNQFVFSKNGICLNYEIF